ncbi:hypothetical protein ACKVV1_011129 [Pyricularia oryzae]
MATPFEMTAVDHEAQCQTKQLAVTGSPAKWSPPTEPIRLKKDAVYFLFTAQNLVRHPKSPLKPLFRAVLLTDPLVDLRNEVEDFTIKSIYPGRPLQDASEPANSCPKGPLVSSGFPSPKVFF